MRPESVLVLKPEAPYQVLQCVCEKREAVMLAKSLKWHVEAYTELDDAHQIVAVSEPVAGDQPRAVRQWKSGSLDNLKGKSVRLRFSLRNARLYSFWSE